MIPNVIGNDVELSVLTAAWRDEQFGDPPTKSKKLVHVEAGYRLYDLCLGLDWQNRALPTMGGALGQHVVGAISTSTHGSDVYLPPLCDFVQAVHLVTTGGREVWIESSSNPLTNNDVSLREALARPDLQIIRDDDMLNSVVVGMGRFGIIYSVVLQVIAPSLRLAEFAQSLPWPEVANALRAVGPGVTVRRPLGGLDSLLTNPPTSLQISGNARDYRYLDLVFSTRNASVCWVRRRWPTLNTTDLNMTGSPDIFCHKGVANGLLVAAAAGLVAYAGLIQVVPVAGAVKATDITLRIVPELKAKALNPHLTGGEALSAVLNAIWASRLEVLGEEVFGDHLAKLINEVSHRVVADTMTASETEGRRGLNWHISAGSGDPKSIGDCYRGNSIEIIFGINDRRKAPPASRDYIYFIDTILAESGKHLHAGYIAVRFTHKSRALLSMHNVAGEVAVSIEVTSLKGISGNDPWMKWIEKTAVSMGGRPHWGQQNNLRKAEVESLYGVETVKKWRNELFKVVGSTETFSNNYTKLRGLEPPGLAEVTSHPGRPSGTTALDLYWGAERGDNFTTATDTGRRSAEAAGYKFVRTEGYVYPTAVDGTTALNLYWSAERGDNFTTATDSGRRDAEAAGYGFVRAEGYVFSSQRPGTVPLNLFWHEGRADNFITASNTGRRDAEAAGYHFVRIEGYIFPQAIALRVHNDQYVSAAGGGGSTVNANRSAIREHETFEVTYLGGNRIALRTSSGFYLCAEEGGGRELVANRNRIDDWEQFELVHRGGSNVALRVHNGMFVSAEGGGGREVVANRSRIDIWETFEIIGV
jgi:hypothetical protein